MATVISIDDDLAQRLGYQARALDLSLEQWAREVLTKGFDLEMDSPRWKKLNGRRLALLKARECGPLNPAQEAELAALQQLTAHAAGAWDQPMLDRLEQFRSAAMKHG